MTDRQEALLFHTLSTLCELGLTKVDSESQLSVELHNCSLDCEEVYANKGINFNDRKG